MKSEITKKKPVSTVARSRAARSDALITNMQKTIEDMFGLPEGSVKLTAPRRSIKLDEGATVGDLRQLWDSK